MKKVLLVLSVAFFTAMKADAQSMGTSYKTALGVKVWDSGGVSFKTFVTPLNALEVIGYFYNDGTRITGLYEIHGPISGARGLKWYIGPGAHIGFYNTRYYDTERTVAGIDGVLGLDLKINRAPINFSIDWQPFLEFSDGNRFVGNSGGLGIRYTF